VVFLVHETSHSGRRSVKLIRAVALKSCTVVNKSSMWVKIPMFRSSGASLPRRGLGSINLTALGTSRSR
jgi:hypothetical protein